MLSERDIVRALAERGAAALEIMKRMTAGRFRHVPVVELGRLVGIVSIGEVVKHRLTAMQHEFQSMLEYVSAP